MERSDFILQYAEQAGMTPQQLIRFGARAIECTCGQDDCQGWRMVQPNGEPLNGQHTPVQA